ncbi:MAG TPA: hypothetical protein VFL31_00705 [Nitrospiraceae bacterium]|nr:hypothetical protein [Nitrospiraceae bacterium]
MVEKALIVLILAHGIFGWGTDEAATQQDQMKDYYYGVMKFLKDECRAHYPDIELATVAPTVPAADSVEARGAKLKEKIERTLRQYPRGTRVHILAHSMGGLDARWVIVQDGMADKIASLTTIATPHRGITLGDLIYAGLAMIMPATQTLKDLSTNDHLASPLSGIQDHLELYHHLLEQIIIDSKQNKDKVQKGLYALTLDGADEFNKRQAAKEQAVRARKKKPVTYFAYGGVAQPDQIPLLRPSHDVIELFGTPEEKQTGNDGAVSVWSAHYPWEEADQHYVKTIPFDHFMQVNWRIPETRPREDMSDDLQAVYREILDRIIRIQRTQ